MVFAAAVASVASSVLDIPGRLICEKNKTKYVRTLVKHCPFQFNVTIGQYVQVRYMNK